MRIRPRAAGPHRLALVLLALGHAPAAAQESPAAASTSRPGWPLGVRFEADYTADALQPVTGGRSQDGAYLDNLDLSLRLDLGVLLGAGETSFAFHVQSNRGTSISERVGDFQGVSNIEAPTDWRVYEAWVQTNPIPGRLSLLFGVADVNAVLDVVPVATFFTHSSFGIGPDYSSSGSTGPSTFPLTSPGARLEMRPRPDLYVTLALSDGASRPDDADGSASQPDEGALVSWEIGLDEPVRRPSSASADSIPGEVAFVRRIGRGTDVPLMRSKTGLGGWVYTGRLPTWEDGEARARSWGLYALAQRLVHAPAHAPDRLAVFLRVGVAGERANRLGTYVGAGAVYRGLFSGREADMLGVGIAHARNGTPFLDASEARGDPLERAETAVEVFYRMPLSDWAGIQPVLGWIIDPGMDPELENALIVGVRGALTFAVP